MIFAKRGRPRLVPPLDSCGDEPALERRLTGFDACSPVWCRSSNTDLNPHERRETAGQDGGGAVGVQLAVSCTGGRGQRAWRRSKACLGRRRACRVPFLAAIGVRVERVGRPAISGTGARVSSRTRPGPRRPLRGPAPPEVPRYRAFRQCCSGALSSPAGPERRRSARYTRRRRSAAATHLLPSMERLREAAQGGATAAGACHRAGVSGAATDDLCATAACEPRPSRCSYGLSRVCFRRRCWQTSDGPLE